MTHLDRLSFGLTPSVEQFVRPRSLPRILVALGNITEVMGLLPYLEALAGQAEFAIVFSEDEHEAIFAERVAQLQFSRVVAPLHESDALWPRTIAMLRGAQRIKAFQTLARHTESMLNALRKWLGSDDFSWLIPWSYSFLEQYRPSVILSGSDRDLRRRVIILKAAHEQRIPIVVLPAAFPAMQTSLFERRTGSGNTIHEGDPIIDQYASHVRKTAGGRLVSYYQTEYYKKYGHLGLIRGNPWAMGGVWADVLLSPSRTVTDQLIKAGLDPEKVRTVGSLEQDKLASQISRRSELRAALLHTRNIADRPNLFIASWAVHQYAEHEMCSWARSQEMVHQVAQSLAGEDIFVFASLHPKMERQEYAWIEKDYNNIALVDEPLHRWIGASDLAIAAGYSSTATWSSALRIPTIIYDFLHLNDSIFKKLRAVRTVYDPEELKKVIVAAAKRETWWQNWVAEAVEDGEISGVLDGRAMERIAAELGIPDFSSDFANVRNIAISNLAFS